MLGLFLGQKVKMNGELFTVVSRPLDNLQKVSNGSKSFWVNPQKAGVVLHG